MRYSQYKFKFYLNASHSIYINGSLGERHPHTWEIAIDVIKKKEDFVEFGRLEREIENWMKQYQDKILNDVPPFNKVNPTLENCCDYFKDAFKKILINLGWTLFTIEMSETPTRSYVINLFEDEEIKTLNQENPDTIAANILNDILGR